MVSRLKATRKKRGHVSMGHGRVGKHRSHPAGRGLAGGQHHHRIQFDMFHPDYFGKNGMRHFHKNKAVEYVPSLNVEKLFHVIGEDKIEELKAQAAKGLAAEIDITKFGYFKLLGKGVVPQIPVVVKARYVSKIAEAKIKAAGGAVVLTA